ncbi:MFS transporter [Nocardia inohanensis]|uniref:MFS transporter n=1 Tax=Nocardia inohanensis TaxID=209246 RepID=UPI000835EBFD|nr:MFS transporter [Nocardia inohanensis]
MAASTSTARPGGIVGVLALAGIIAAVMQTLVVPLLGELPQLLHTSGSNASWVVTATLLASAVTTPVAGRLGDLYGKRLMLLVSTVPLIAGSVVCALADSVAPMIIGRGLQGMGMGILPLGISALRDLLPAERVGPSIAMVSASMGIGGALGLPIAAAVAQHADWRVLFWGAAGLSLLIAVLIYAVVPDVPVIAKGRFDIVGAVGLGVGLICLLLGVSKGATWGWGSGTILGLFAAAIAVLTLWGWWELRVTDPMVDLRVTARPRVLLTNASSMVLGFGMYSASLLIPQLLQLPKATGYGLGQSMLAMGLWMAPGGIVMMLVSPLGAKLSALRGPKVTLVAGAVILSAGYGVSTLLMGSTWGLLISVCVCNIGVALAYGAMPALIMSAVPLSETAAANSFNTLMRAIGTSFSAAVIGAVLAQLSTTLGGHPIPTESGFRTGLLIGCGVALAAAAIAALIPYRKENPAVSGEPEPTAAARVK